MESTLFTTLSTNEEANFSGGTQPGSLALISSGGAGGPGGSGGSADGGIVAIGGNKNIKSSSPTFIFDTTISADGGKGGNGGNGGKGGKGGKNSPVVVVPG